MRSRSFSQNLAKTFMLHTLNTGQVDNFFEPCLLVLIAITDVLKLTLTDDRVGEADVLMLNFPLMMNLSSDTILQDLTHYEKVGL